MTIDEQTPRLRDRIARRTFVDDVVVSRRAGMLPKTDSEGNVLKGHDPLGTIKGRWGLPTATDIEIAAQDAVTLDGIVTIAPDADVLQGDHVTITAPDGADLGSWRVTRVRPGRVQAKAHLVKVTT